MHKTKQNRLIFFLCLLFIIGSYLITGCSSNQINPVDTSTDLTTTASPITETENTMTTQKVTLSAYNGIQTVSIFVEGYEWGPAVTKLIIEFNEVVSDYNLDGLSIITSGTQRDIHSTYFSDADGEAMTEASKFITVEIPVIINNTTKIKGSSPFTYNMTTWQNEWSSTYQVTLLGEEIEINNNTYTLNYSEDCINNRISKDTALFTHLNDFSGEYLNPFTNTAELLTLHRADYEPETLKGDDSNPLIIWLHGQGEGGIDPDIVILGNEVSALAKEPIQSNFHSGDEQGAYVLLLQTETYWMDEGDGKNGGGAGISRYTEIVMDAILDYVTNNPDVDPKRIYLGGCSNGGYMTMNLLFEYPGYFAAAYPICEAYAYRQYTTDALWVTPEKINTLIDQPIWFIHSMDDTVVAPSYFSSPTYQTLVQSGATNAWFSMFETVKGTDNPNTNYMGHFSWIYFFNNQVTGVQDKKGIAESTDISNYGFIPSNELQGGAFKATGKDGTVYSTIFEWLNAQHK